MNKGNLSHKEIVLNTMYAYEETYEEDIFDINNIIQVPTFMNWALSMKYLTTAAYKAWEDDFKNDSACAKDPQYIIYDCYSTGAIPYAIVKSKEWNGIDKLKAYGIAADYISSGPVSYERYMSALRNKVNQLKSKKY
ncbi:hypothetical protein [Clostridium tertium]|uniref:hypothetical protein n=1 Tax=Clostridium tertium TaxID=1559 RepID=UPI0023B311DB|nr:hypothetical protein [Clostridium tertium]